MFFRENIKAILAKNPHLAKRLSEIYLSQAEEKIEVYTAETGDYVFSYDGLILDDMLNPKELAALNCEENIPSDFNKDDIIVVFGLGTGYLIDYISEKYDANIVFLEPKLDIFRYALEFIGFEGVFTNKRLKLATDINEAFSLVKDFLGTKKRRITLIYPDAYEQLVPDELNDILSKMTELAGYYST